MPSTKRRADNMDDTTSSRKRQHIKRTISEAADDGHSRQDVALRGRSSLEAERPAAVPAVDNEHLKALKLLHTDFDLLRATLTCRICERLFYEPYVLSCGHTYCYRCLSTWFNSTRKMSCPNCRVRISQLPAPAYAIKEMVVVMIRRAELLPEGETMEEHETWKREEAEFLALERENTDPRKGGLFQGRFRRRRPDFYGTALPAINDAADGVARCPRCHWELEGGRCEHCDMSFDSEGYEMSASEDDDSFTDGLDAVDAEFDPPDSEAMWYDGEMTPHGGSDYTVSDGEQDHHHHHHHHHVHHDHSGSHHHHHDPRGEAIHSTFHGNAHDAALRAMGHNMSQTMGRRPGSPRPPVLYDVDGFGYGYSDDEDDEEDDDESGSMHDFVVDDEEIITISSEDGSGQIELSSIDINPATGRPWYPSNHDRQPRRRIAIDDSDDGHRDQDDSDNDDDDEGSDSESDDSNTADESDHPHAIHAEPSSQSGPASTDSRESHSGPSDESGSSDEASSSEDEEEPVRTFGRGRMLRGGPAARGPTTGRRGRPRVSTGRAVNP